MRLAAGVQAAVARSADPGDGTPGRCAWRACRRCPDRLIPAGGLAWHEVQLSAVSGDPAVWQVSQVGAWENGDVPVTAWQVAQLLVKPAEFTVVWAVARNGTAWLAPPSHEEVVCWCEWQLTVHVWFVAL